MNFLVNLITGLWIILPGLTSAATFDPDTTVSKNPGDSSLVKELYEIVITANRYEQSTFSAPRSMTFANDQNIKEKNQLSLLDVLDDKIGIWIEKRTSTASDPIIRGLSGSNILALVDGNTLSTFWGEGGFAGDDMYGKVDAESIDRIEILRGPASVMYGSNALGGVVNFFTKQSPLDYTEQGSHFGGKLKGALGYPSKYIMGRVETWGASSRFKYLVGSTVHNAGNIHAGGGIGNIIPSGGKDWSLDMNTEFRINPKNFINLGGQYLKRPEAYRSYRPTQSNKNERVGLNLGYRSTQSTRLYDVLNFNLYYQYKKDIRLWYTGRSLDTASQEGFAWWKTYCADIHALKELGEKNRLVYGVSYHLDIAESPDDEQFTIKTTTGDQQAAPGTNWHNAGIFLNDEWDVIKLLTLSAGIRYDYFFLHAEDDVFYIKPGDPDTSKNKPVTDPGSYAKNALTGSAAAVLHLHQNFNLALTWSYGFRMFPPSFGIRQTGYGVIIPNGFLDPVTADMFEVSPRIRTEAIDLSLSAYYTQFTNFQQPVQGTYNGNEYIDYNNDGVLDPDERVYVNAANGDAYVTGIEMEFAYNLGSLSKALKGFRLEGGVMYNYGRMQFPESEEMPFRHTHPLRGLVKLRYDYQTLKWKVWAEFSSDIVDRYDEIEETRLHSDVGYLEDPQDPNSGLYREYGLPSYTVFDLQGGVIFNKNYCLTLAIENIFDIRYRTAHSRMDAPGRNFLLGLELMLPKISAK